MGGMSRSQKRLVVSAGGYVIGREDDDARLY